jgi:hypothetical protein
MIRRTLFLAAAACLLAAQGCDLSKLTGTGTPAITTTQSIWINANWGGGRTGSPLDLKAITPNNLSGSYCPATSVLLYNHGSPIPGWTNVNGLILKNNCNVSVSYLVCSTAGGSQSNGIPKCAIDPQMTLLSSMITIELAGGEFTYVGNTSLDAGVNVFYCPSGNQFTLGIVKSATPTDCWKP